MSAQKVLPVITSIIIIFLVAVLRERSRTAAAIFATMPINMPLALWVVFGGTDASSEQVEAFVRALIIGLIPGFIWLGVVFVLVKAGWPLLAAIGGGYVVWGALTAALFALGILSFNR